MMWPHAIALPIVLPLICGALLLLLERRAAQWVPRLAGATTAVGLLVALWLAWHADSGTVHVYLLGNWAAQFGIALALDRLSALMVLLTAMLGCASLLYAAGGDARRGRHFHSLFQFQLMGLNGAFLTADLFNLFVFFEVLLIASYGLLLHGAGAARLRASIHYVSFNLAGSALFLIAVSLLYGLTGTLNMAELAQRVPQAAPDRVLLVQSAALMLIVVFGVKAALLPLYFWLPATYGAASAPVAALFAVMTKVGVYAILRVTTLIFGASAGPAAMVASPWLELLALATLLLGAAGALAAESLRAMIGNVVIASAGTLLLAVALARPDSVAAGLFYLVNSTLATAALFMLADRVRAARGAVQDTFAPGPASALVQRLGALFFVFAIAAAGLPPLAGFMGKAMLLRAAGQTPWAGWIVAIVLSSSLLTMVAFARGGSSLFWKHASPAPGPGIPATQGAADASDAPMTSAAHTRPEGPAPSEAALPNHRAHGAALLVLLGLLGACAVLAAPLSRYTQATAQQLFERTAYLRAVLGAQPVPAAIDVRREMRERKAGQAAKP
jgi:multicomponent K+:H+ antiporter subunit D